MKWNYETNLPVEGSYRRITHDPVRVKEILKEYENMVGTKEMMSLIESVNYDPDEFLLQKLYKNIPNVVPAQFITLLAFQFDAKPFLKDYFFDIANGYWDIFNRPDGFKWNNASKPMQDMDIITRLYFADSEEDIWDMVDDLPYYVKDNLFSLYEGDVPTLDFPICLKDDDKALEMSCYLNSKGERHFRSKYITIIIDHRIIMGRVKFLKEDSMIVRLNKPICHSIDVTVPEQCRGKVYFMTQDEDGYKFTNSGEDIAITRLRELYHEEKDILSDQYKVLAMLADYHRRETERQKKWGSIMTKQARQNGAITAEELLEQIQYEYYPDLRRVVFDEEFMLCLEKKIMGD